MYIQLHPSVSMKSDLNRIAVYYLWGYTTDVGEILWKLRCMVKVVIHVEMPKAAPKKSICLFQKLEMILKWNQQNTVRLPQKYQFVFIKHKINC